MIRYEWMFFSTSVFNGRITSSYIFFQYPQFIVHCTVHAEIIKGDRKKFEAVWAYQQTLDALNPSLSAQLKYMRREHLSCLDITKPDTVVDE